MFRDKNVFDFFKHVHNLRISHSAFISLKTDIYYSFLEPEFLSFTADEK